VRSRQRLYRRRVDGDGRAHVEEPREPSGFPDADEGVEGVFRSRAEMDAFPRPPEKSFYVSTAHDLEALTHTFDAFDEVLPTLG